MGVVVVHAWSTAFLHTHFSEAEMATIEQRISNDGSKAWRVRVRLKGHPMQTATFERKTDAQEWAKRIETRIAEGEHFPHREQQRHTVAELIDAYVTNVLPHKLRNRDEEERRRCLAWWRQAIGDYRLSAADAVLLTEQRNKLLSEGRAGSTVNRYLAALSHAFSTARKWRWIGQNPCGGLRLNEPPGRTRFLSPDERRRLLAQCRASRQVDVLYPVVVLALSTGMRQGEILGLTWADVDFKNRTIRLEHTKNGDRRLVPLYGPAFDAMKGVAKVRRIDSKLVFPGGDPDKPADFRNAWVRALARAKVENFRFHDLRHSAASELAMSGATPSEIAAVLGHRTLAMVKRYAHIADAHTAKVVERMNEAVFGK
jgi:integrase